MDDETRTRVGTLIDDLDKANSRDDLFVTADAKLHAILARESVDQMAGIEKAVKKASGRSTFVGIVMICLTLALVGATIVGAWATRVISQAPSRGAVTAPSAPSASPVPGVPSAP